MAEALIELKDIYKIYQMGSEEVRANDGIDLTIDRGEFVAIVGKGIYNRRHGKSSCSCGGSCGGGCGHCASSGLCHPEKQPPTRRGAAGAP